MIEIKMCCSDAIFLYNILHDLVRTNRQELEDQQLNFIANFNKTLADKAHEYDLKVCAKTDKERRTR